MKLKETNHVPIVVQQFVQQYHEVRMQVEEHRGDRLQFRKRKTQIKMRPHQGHGETRCTMFLKDFRENLEEDDVLTRTDEPASSS